MQLILITGLSGSGKSVALDVLEDAGYYCVDNLPVQLVSGLAGHLAGVPQERVALGVDARSGAALGELPACLEGLRTRGIDVRVLYLEAKDDTLIKRFSETRRRHPLSDGERTLVECIARERDLLAGLEALGHRVDTSDLLPTVLRAWIREFAGTSGSGLTLLVESFAFKHGVPLDADFVFDVRCLPNPHYDPALRPLTGRDEPVAAFLAAEPEVARMLEDIRRFVAGWLPAFVRDNRSYLTIAVGCTGGRHRSVFLVERLAQAFAREARVLVRHREPL